MLSVRASIICAAVATAIALLCHPRVFYGDGAAMALVSFDDLFFAGQWTAFVLAVASLVIALYVMRSGGASAAGITAAYSAILTVWLLLTGIPHPANKSEWANRVLGAKAFAKGMQRTAKANAKPVPLSAAAFAGAWTGVDGNVFTFAADAVTLRGPAANIEYSRTACGDSFSVEYVERDREVLQDFGLMWSTHAVAAHEKAAADAKFPVAHVACGQDRFVFIRASDTEVWRWTNSMDANDVKDPSFVLHGPG